MGTAGSFFYHALLMVKSTSYWLRNCDRVIILRKGGLEASGFDMRAQIIWARIASLYLSEQIERAKRYAAALSDRADRERFEKVAANYQSELDAARAARIVQELF